jgi:hypothetical protein
MGGRHQGGAKSTVLIPFILFAFLVALGRRLLVRRLARQRKGVPSFFTPVLFGTENEITPQFCCSVTRHLLLPSSALRVTFTPNGQRGSPAAPVI